MQIAPLFLALLATYSSALPSSHSDNAYPAAPRRYADAQQEYVAPMPTSTPCTTSTAEPTSTTPCETEPTALPYDADSRQDVSPDNMQRPTCPPPQTITLPPVVHTATRTVHSVRTATVTSVSVSTVVSTVVKPEVRYKTIEKPKYITTTCTKTSTVQEYVTKTKTCTETTTVQKEVTKTVTDYKTVTKDNYVTRTVGALPTTESKPPAPSAYGPVKPIEKCNDCEDVDSNSAYPSTGSYSGSSPSEGDQYDDTPMYLSSANQDSAYGY